MLTFAEELLLLSHDERSGLFLDLPELLVNTALAGAVLMELAILNRIDTDLDHLMIVDKTPTGEPLLDGILARIAAEPGLHGTPAWLDALRQEGPRLHAAAVARLVERGILRQEHNRFLWVFETRRYPLIENREQQEVKLRIASLLLSDDIPDARDVVIIALAESCGLLKRVFSEEELRRSHARIQQIVRLDLIGQAVRSTIQDLQSLVVTMAGYPG